MPDRPPSREAARPNISRRQILRGVVVGGLAIGGGRLLAACSPTDENGTDAATDSEVDDVNGQEGGTLRVGVVGGSASDTLDAHGGTSNADIARGFQLYEPLALRNQDFVMEMVLAEEIVPNEEADVWTIRLKPDIAFHDGRTVTADDVVFSLQRITDPDDPKVGASVLSAVDHDGIEAVDELTVRVPLTRPSGIFDEEVGQYFNAIVPVDYDPEDPVGTGPFKLESFTPGEEARFVKHEAYWRPNEPHVDELVIINFADDSARANALMGGQVDIIDQFPIAQLTSIEEDTSFDTLISETGAWLPFTMRVDTAPFDDVRVRQAMRLIAGREQLIDQSLAGQGLRGNDLYSPFDPCFNSDLPQRQQEIERARELLAEAGQEDLEVELVTAEIAAGVVESAQVLAQQASEAGVTINVRRVDSDVFFGEDYLSWPFAQSFWFTRSYLLQVAQSSLPGSPFNETHWEDEEFIALIEEARLTADDDERCALLEQAQELEYERGGYIIWGFNNQVDAFSTDVTGLEEDRTGIPLNSYGFRKVQFV